MTNVSLYSLAAEYSGQLQALENLDLDEKALADTLESLGGDLEVKAQNVVCFLRNLETTAAAIKEAEADMAARRKAIEKRVDGLKRYVLDSMQGNGIQKIECPLFRISIVKNPPAVDVFDEKQIPADYFVTPPAPPPQLDKKKIAEALKADVDVPGAVLHHGTRLSIK